MKELFSRKPVVEEYAVRSAGKTDREKRALEEVLLTPAPLPPVTVPTPAPITPLARYVKVYFATQDEFDEFCNIVPVGTSHEHTTRHSTMIMTALRGLK